MGNLGGSWTTSAKRLQKSMNHYQLKVAEQSEWVDLLVEMTKDMPDTLPTLESPLLTVRQSTASSSVIQ